MGKESLRFPACNSLRAAGRAATLALATVLVLSACSTSKPADPPTSATSHTAGAASPSPSESTPAPGEWTLEDLKVGATVPKEDLERLFPRWSKPTPPATLTENSEQGAKDAAVYFDALAKRAFQTRDVDLISRIDDGNCFNCDDVRTFIQVETPRNVYSTPLENTEIVATQDIEDAVLYEVAITQDVAMSVQLDGHGDRIEEISEGGAVTSYYYVKFLDGRWSALYINLDRSQF
ncbi:DUF6318 family protein [Bowdeniella massiliensis]|uniref:DUF6318 family protein n=1 Tax=Bowdeniella massiliensis TaxID=2932264 RepID=UPI0020284074|nr:DUF6318 family protein [Bowdeniella massiliensis]